jgi:hypothetical protein
MAPLPRGRGRVASAVRRHSAAGALSGHKDILRKVNKLALTALRLAASRKDSTVGEAILLDATTDTTTEALL